jgi:hypothetical protein
MYSDFMLQVEGVKNRLNIVPQTGHKEDVMSELKIGGINQRELEKVGSTHAPGDAGAFTQSLLSQLEENDLALLDDKIEGKVQSPSRLDLSGLSNDSPEKALRSNINFV